MLGSQKAGEVDKLMTTDMHLFLLFLVLASLLLTTLVSAQPPEPVKFVSDKPMFVKLALSAEKAPLVGVAFDESKGTGKGYDTVYVDANANGVFEASEKHAAESGAGPTNFVVPLPGSLFAATVKDKTVQTTAGVRFMLYAMGTKPSLMTTLNLSLKQAAGVWDYSLTASGATPGTRASEAPVLHAGPLTLVPTIRPGARCGLAARLAAGDFSLSCSGPDGGASNIAILIKSQSGQTVHQDSVPLGRLGFG